MSPVPSRYIRAIYLLPGVKGGSEAKRAKGASQAAEKEDNCCRSCDTVSLFYCCKVGSWRSKKKMYSGTVVYFCVGSVKSSMVLFFSGMSSTVISSTVYIYIYIFFYLVYSLATRKQKRNESLQFSSSFMARPRARSKVARAIQCS